MALRIDTTKTVKVEIEGESVEIRTLTGRQRLEVLAHAGRISALVSGMGDDAAVTPEVAIAAQRENFAILALGLVEDPDIFPPSVWSQLVGEILAANQLTGDDRKNSPSP